MNNTVKIVRVDPRTLTNTAALLPLEALGAVETFQPPLLSQVAPSEPTDWNRQRTNHREYVLCQTNTLLKRINSAEIQKKAADEKLWKIRRCCLIEIEELGGHKALGHKSFHEFCKAALPKAHFNTYFDERRCGRYERLLGIPLCSYGRTIYVPLNAIEVFPRHQGNQWQETIELPPTERKIELLKMAWTIALNNAKGKVVRSQHVYLAVEELHLRFPTEVKSPNSHNLASKEKKELRELKKQNAQLVKLLLFFAHCSEKCCTNLAALLVGLILD